MRLNHLQGPLVHCSSFSRAGRLDCFHEFGLHALEQLVLYQLLNNWLRVVFLECCTASISLEEVKDCSIIWIPTDAVVDTAWLRCSKSCCLRVYSLKGICVL
jgi:hypothetical protein